MTCRRARRSLYELRYGAVADAEGLDEHLAGCAGCRAERDRLVRLDAVLAATPCGEPEGTDLERVTAAALADIARTPVAAPRALWPRVAGVAAAACLVFACGLMAGRGLFPREVVRTRVVDLPRIVERTVEVPVHVPVEVPVQVVRDRVVVREVRVPGPRHSPAQPTARPEATNVAGQGGFSGPVKLNEVDVPVLAVSVAPPPAVVREILPVTPVKDAPPPHAPTDEPQSRSDGPATFTQGPMIEAGSPSSDVTLASLN
jgi:hypothetical protein